MDAHNTMTRHVTVIPPELSLSAAWQIMTHDRIRHLPVVVRGALMGIVSDRDLLARATLVDGEPRMPGGIVGDAMSAAPVTCTMNTSVASLAEQMISRKIDCMPVVDRGGQLLGIVTSTDLLALLTGTHHATILPFEFKLQTPEVYAA